MSGYSNSFWPCEDHDSSRSQVVNKSLDATLEPFITSRSVILATMAVFKDNTSLFLLRHTAGDNAISFVEKLDPFTLVPLGRSEDLPGGKTWPGSIGIHRNGFIYVVFGNHIHKLDDGLNIVATSKLPRDRPYNGFIILDDGTIITKDFGGRLPNTAEDPCQSVQLLAIDPDDLLIMDTLTLDEKSIARISSYKNRIYVVGEDSLFEIKYLDRFQSESLRRFNYRTMESQQYGWDCVVNENFAWFLDSGEGTENYSGNFIGKGNSTIPINLVRVDLKSSEVTLTPLSDKAKSIVANPPLWDISRQIVVAFDSSNGILKGFQLETNNDLAEIWSREQNHASHMVLFGGNGALVTCDFNTKTNEEDIVILDISTGAEIKRIGSQSNFQSVVFLSPGVNNDLYYISFSTITRVAFV